MVTLSELEIAIIDISKNHYIQTASGVALTDRINEAVMAIAGGIKMPDGVMSTPLPDLLETAVVATTVNAYASLPATYQRNVFYIVDTAGVRVPSSLNGEEYSFLQFLNNATKKDLSTVGDVTYTCVKGSSLYYQGIPSVSVNLTIMFYRKPVAMVNDSDTPDGIPDQFQTRLIKHYVGRQLASEMVDGLPKMAEYHNNEFYSAMRDMIDFIGYDVEPVYFLPGDD